MMPGSQVWRSSDARRTWISLAILALFTAAFFFPVLFLGQAMYPSSVLGADPIWSPQVAGWHDSPNNQLYDHVTQFLPWRVVTEEGLQQGTVPQWNPYDGVGEPLLGAIQPGVFYPLNLLVLPVGPARAAGIRAALSLFLAAAGTLLFLRSLRLVHSAALFGALAFGYCQFNVAWAGNSIGAVVIWLPWLLLAAERLLDRPSAIWIAALAAFWAISLFGGHIESSIQMAVLLGAYALWRLIGIVRLGGWHRAILSAAQLGGGLAIGTGLAAVQWLPVLDYLPLTVIGALRGSGQGITLDSLLGSPVQWLTSMVTLLPDIFGNPTRTSYWFRAAINYGEAACYFGVTATVLVLATGRWTFRQQYAPFFLGALIVSGGISFQFPIVGVLGQIFPLSVTMLTRVRLEYSFSGAVLAAIVLHQLASREDPVWPAQTVLRGIRRWALLAALPLLFVGLGLAASSIPHLRQGIDWRAFFPLIWLGALIAASQSLRNRALSRRAFLALLLVFQAADLFITGFDFNPMVPVSHVAPVTPVITYLRTHAQGYRVVGVDAAVPNTLSAFGIADIAIYDPAVPATYSALWRRWTGRGLYADLRFTKQAMRGLQLPLLDALSVKYVVAGEPLPLPSGGRWQHLRIGAVDLYQNLQALPPAHLVRRVRCLPSEGAVLDAVTSPAFRPATEALAVCGAHALRFSAARGTPAGGGVLRSTARGLNGTDIMIDNQGPGILVLAQQDLPGWTVSAGHTSYPIVGCDGVLQCVALPGGRLSLQVRYQAPGFETGLVISAVSAVAELALLGFGVAATWRWQWRRP